MTTPIRRVGVIGAGVMGSGIAAHFANAGVEVILLDIVPPGLSDEEKKDPKKRNGFAAGGKQNAIKGKPAAFMEKAAADLVSVGNTEDDLERLKGVDLVVEAIIERLDIKQSLFAKLEAVIDEGTIVASNTSGLGIVAMLEGRGESFRQNFLVMHFFNPVRHMKLLELVAGPETSPEVMERIKKAGQNQLGKGIVVGKDTPNFVGNRVGCHSMTLTMQKMFDHDLAAEDIDAITGPPMGHPKSASFRTADMVGLDTMVHVSDNCYAALPDDPERDAFKIPDVVRKMVEKGILGNKSRGGFYKKTKEGILTFDHHTLEYRPKGGDPEIKKVCKELGDVEDVRERVRQLVAGEGKPAEVAWELLSRSMAYSATIGAEIADDIEAIDNAMKWGYNWELGPFETWDALGFEATYERMKADGLSLPDAIHQMAKSGKSTFYTDDGDMMDLATGEYVARDIDPRNASLAATRKGESAVYESRGLDAWDLGDGVLGITFKTKANSIDSDIISAIPQALDEAERNFESVVIYNEGPHFCVGANLMAVVMASQQKAWDQLRATVVEMQSAMQRIKYSSVPVVAAPYGMAVGGGLELCMASDAVQGYCETYSGLVEAGVGLLPGGAGNLNMLWKALGGIPDGANVDPIHLVSRVFENIAMARVTGSAFEGISFGYFNAGDQVTFDKDRLLFEAKSRAIGLARAGYSPPKPKAYRLPGESGVATLQMMIDTLVAGGFASEHDGLIASKIAHVLCGGVAGNSHPVTEAEMLELEAEAFVSLCGEEKSQARMQHMLMKNKPLRN